MNSPEHPHRAMTELTAAGCTDPDYPRCYPPSDSREDPALNRSYADCTPVRPSHCTVATENGRGVRVDLEVLIDECRKVIYTERGDGSPPLVALSADVVCAVASFARTLAQGVALARSPAEVRQWQTFAAAGPSVGGPGAADAGGDVVHPIHVSAVY